MKKKMLVLSLMAFLMTACLDTAVAVDLSMPAAPTARVSVYVTRSVSPAMDTGVSPTATTMDQYTVCVDALNVRGVPAAENGVITWLAIGDPVRVYEVVDGWGRVSSESGDWALWVNMKYLCK